MTNFNNRPNFPRLELPKIPGIYTEWPPFRGLYTSILGNDQLLPKIQKLNYLKVILTEEPAQLIANILTTAENFDRTWQILLTRYDNDRELINIYLAKLFNLPVMSRESTSELLSLLNDFIEAVVALSSL